MFCDSFKRSAMRLRIRVILTRDSVRAPAFGATSLSCLPASFFFGSSFFGSFFGSSFFGSSFFGSSFFGSSFFGSSFFGSSLFSSSFFGSSLFPSSLGCSFGASPGSILNRSLPTSTLSSASAYNSVMTPDSGELTATSILSVSIVATSSLSFT